MICEKLGESRPGVAAPAGIGMMPLSPNGDSYVSLVFANDSAPAVNASSQQVAVDTQA